MNIGGSFYGSTADSILFPDGEFSAIAPNNQPILTINAPIGLNLRDNPGEITATGTTERLSLSVEQGESFNLVGGEIKLDFGVVPLTEGSIELVSVSQASTIGITENNTFNIPEDIDLADISLNDFGLEITAESMDSGILKLTGKSVTLSNSSIVSNTSMGTGSAGNIEVNTSDSLLINTDAGIFSNTFAQGNAGAINITAGDNITLEGTNTEEPTGIFSGANLNGTILTGSAGEIRLEANNISLSDGAEINTNTFGSGVSANCGRT